MALNPSLRDELAQMLREMPPAPVELVCATGEILSSEALTLARLYDSATSAQRDALDQIAAAFKGAQ